MTTRPDMMKRFSPAQRIAHWVLTSGFLALTATGFVLLSRGLGPLAAGGASRLIHRAAAVLFLLAPVSYLLFDPKGLARLVKDSFTYDQDDLRWFLHFPRYVLGRAKGLPPQGRINAGEKLHHAAIILLFFAISISGLFLWFGKSALTAGQFAWMLIIHDVAMFLMVLLTLGHIYFATVYGAMSGMVTGYVTRAYALLEHPKWVADEDGAKTAEGRKSA